MSCITKQHIGKYTYIYKSTSYRDQNGKPRNRKICIGKIDPATGETIYKPSYLKEIETQSEKKLESTSSEKNSKDIKEKLTDSKIHNYDTIKNDNSKNDQQINTESSNLLNVNNGLQEESLNIEKILDSTKRYGSFYLFKYLAVEIKLLPLLEKIFPDIYKEIFVLACFLIETQEPLMYCYEWLSETCTFADIRNLNSQYISNLLQNIKESDKNNFFEMWIKNIEDSEYIALDITSISSYSQLIESCEWGYNRDKEKLPQINLCMLFGEGSKFPVFFKDYLGSIADVATLNTTIKEIQQIIPNSKFRFVMDKGFYSKANIDAMIENKIEFLISVPFNNSFAINQVNIERTNIDTINNTIITANDTIRGKYKIIDWNYGSTKIPINLHIYYNPLKAMKEKNDLFRYITELKIEAMKNVDNSKLKSEFEKYFVIEKSSDEKTYTINIREDKINDKLKTCGWMILMSNYLADTQYALDVYRRKDIVEKGYDRLKNSLDVKRLRVHNDTKMKNKLFIAFIAIIIISSINQRMINAGLYKQYTMHEVILKLKKIKIAIVRNKYILQPITKEQRDIFKALQIPVPCISTVE